MLEFIKRQKDCREDYALRKEKIIPKPNVENSISEINTDPLGSWTGTPDDPFDMPVQDADDL